MKVLKFGAVWCPGCLIMKPRWKEIEAEHPWLQTEYYEFDEHKDVVEKYNISALPVFVFLDKNEKEFLRLEGEIEKEKLIEIINQNKEK
jgi:thiol-disulfide isomerase/thioredoxin